MNVNCNRDPLTCKCDYHLGFDDRLNAAFGKPVLDLETHSRLPLPEPWKPTEAQMLEAAGINDPARQREKTARLALSYRTGRPPIAPGVLLDDDEARVYVSRGVLRIVARWALGFGMVAAGAAVMYAEGQRQPQPGVGFAIGLALMMGAALLVTKGRDDG